MVSGCHLTFTQQMFEVVRLTIGIQQGLSGCVCVCRFETLVKKVLLGQRFPGVFFGHSVMRFINHQFMTHDFTTAVLRKGLQVTPYPLGTVCL